MSTKAKKNKESNPTNAKKAGKQAPAKTGSLKAAPAVIAPANMGSENSMNPEEMQDHQEEQEELAAGATAAPSEDGNAAAIAAASSGTETSASFKNFRHHPDMENFYRFIYDNDLRHEALAIIDEIIQQKQQRRLLKTAKTQAH